jgi:biotin carboxyl carrier protein
MDFRDIATVLEYLDGKTQTLPSGVTVDVRRDTPAPSAQSRSAPPKPEGVLVRAPCPGRVVPASGPGVVREGETIGEIQCGRRRVAIIAPITGHVGQWFFESGQFVEFDQALVVLKRSPLHRRAGGREA